MMNKFLVGFDEAGRGPLAGPVCAAAVILPSDFCVEILNDSKKLSEKKRKSCEIIIKEKACYGISSLDHTVIDKINILQASLLAMKNAYSELMKVFPLWYENNFNEKYEPGKYLFEGIADGNFSPEVDFSCRHEPKADGKYSEVMAASILAKTWRDDFMTEMDKLYPEYGYAKHKGYPTKAHKDACRKYGASPIQRVTFKY